MIVLLMQEHQRLMELEREYEEWCDKNPNKYSYEYEGERAPRARIERTGIMLRQAMISYERYAKNYF